MIYDLILKAFRKQFYLVSTEKLKNLITPRYLERYSAKHRLLTPELIMVNDQPYGFRRLSQRLQSLEQYPIFFELEYIEEGEDERFVQSFDLFTEVVLPIGNRLNELTELSEIYSDYVVIERVKRIGIPDQSSLLFYSTIGTWFLQQFFEEDVEERIFSEEDLLRTITDLMTCFSHFISAFDEVFTKGKRIDDLDVNLLP